MSVRRIAARAAIRAGSGHEQPKKNRTGGFALLILGAGGVSGVAALLGVPPFGNLQVFVKQIVQGPPSGPIEARGIFPAVPPVHQVIDVYDPAPPPLPPPAAAPAPPAAPAPKPPQPPQATPTPRHHPSPNPTPPVTSSPSPSPSPGGGGD
jgi:hypothetical protein